MRSRTRLFFPCFILAVLLIVAVPILRGQEVSVRSSVDSTHITLGDWLNLTVEVKHARPVTVLWSTVGDTLGTFEVVHTDSLPRIDSGDVVTEGRKFTLSKYDSGSFVIPPVVIAYRDAGDTALHYVQSDPVAIAVSSVPVDTSKAIKDIKQPLSLPLTWKEIGTVAGIIAAIAALLYGAYYYYRKKMKKNVDVAEYEAPKIPPHIVAIDRLKELQEKRVWQQGKVKAFYSEATEIIRQYFEGRYGIMALELTSDEVLAQLKRFSLEPEVMKSTESFFVNADLVKFAKYMPVPSENEDVIPQALAIVERTKPVAEVVQNV